MPVQYHLYRAKFIKPRQPSLFAQKESPQTIFLGALQERPYAAFRENYTWHIGNVTEFNPNTGYFAVGRNTPTSIPKLDHQTGDFVDTEDDTSPYTYVVYDASIGLLGIKTESRLAATTEELAMKIQKLLGQTEVAMKSDVNVKIDRIPDPQDFIAKLMRAYAIKKFTASFTGPNPFDADELFQKPLSVYLNAAAGTHGNTTIQGTSLNSEVVSSVARSTAATGNDASARVQEKAGVRSIKIELSGNPLKITYEEDVALATVLKDAKAAYEKVRHDGD